MHNLGAVWAQPDFGHRETILEVLAEAERLAALSAEEAKQEALASLPAADTVELIDAALAKADAAGVAASLDACISFIRAAASGAAPVTRD